MPSESPLGDISVDRDSIFMDHTLLISSQQHEIMPHNGSFQQGRTLSSEHPFALAPGSSSEHYLSRPQSMFSNILFETSQLPSSMLQDDFSFQHAESLPLSPA